MLHLSFLLKQNFLLWDVWFTDRDSALPKCHRFVVVWILVSLKFPSFIWLSWASWTRKVFIRWYLFSLMHFLSLLCFWRCQFFWFFIISVHLPQIASTAFQLFLFQASKPIVLFPLLTAHSLQTNFLLINRHCFD